MRSDRFVLFAGGLLATTVLAPLAGCAQSDMALAQSHPAQPIELACKDPAANAPVADARSYALADGSGTLWLVPCMRGAYQTAYNLVFVPDDGQARRLLFAQWRNDSWTGTADVFDPAFDAQSGLLTDQYKDRGVGDCGGERRWQWNGHEFRLLEYRARTDCNGSSNRFPVIFEASPLP